MPYDALKQKRYRRHRRGFHDLCRPEFCADAAAAMPEGEIAAAVAGLLSHAHFSEDDPRAVMGVLAARLAEAADARTTPAAARELRVLLVQMLEARPSDRWGGLDEIRLRRSQRRVETLLKES